jgi:hypothetical protein
MHCERRPRVATISRAKGAHTFNRRYRSIDARRACCGLPCWPVWCKYLFLHGPGRGAYSRHKKTLSTPSAVLLWVGHVHRDVVFYIEKLAPELAHKKRTVQPLERLLRFHPPRHNRRRMRRSHRVSRMSSPQHVHASPAKANLHAPPEVRAKFVLRGLQGRPNRCRRRLRRGHRAQRNSRCQ